MRNRSLACQVGIKSAPDRSGPHRPEALVFYRLSDNTNFTTVFHNLTRHVDRFLRWGVALPPNAISSERTEPTILCYNSYVNNYTRTGMPDKELWQELCKQASTEQNSKKLTVLVKEINRLLKEKHANLQDEAARAD